MNVGNGKRCGPCNEAYREGWNAALGAALSLQVINIISPYLKDEDE